MTTEGGVGRMPGEDCETASEFCKMPNAATALRPRTNRAHRKRLPTRVTRHVPDALGRRAAAP